MRKTSYFGKFRLSKEQYLSAKYYAMRYTEYQLSNSFEKTKKIEDAAKEADEEIYEYIILSAIEDIPFWRLEQDGIPCGRDKFYNARRKFFYLLAHKI